ncbi:hypothetical protein JL100_005880 [Skermanella mucosa]|nr:hypothetical protein JL100_005880 [Skermanella mucosa]
MCLSNTSCGSGGAIRSTAAETFSEKPPTI